MPMDPDNKSRVTFWSCIAAYLITGFLTYGYLYNSLSDQMRIQREVCKTTTSGSCDLSIGNADRALGSMLGGMLWPLYWGGKIAIILTK